MGSGVMQAHSVPVGLRVLGDIQEPLLRHHVLQPELPWRDLSPGSPLSLDPLRDPFPGLLAEGSPCRGGQRRPHAVRAPWLGGCRL